jgi:hypothetical protein
MRNVMIGDNLNSKLARPAKIRKALEGWPNVVSTVQRTANLAPEEGPTLNTALERPICLGLQI